MDNSEIQHLRNRNADLEKEVSLLSAKCSTHHKANIDLVQALIKLQQTTSSLQKEVEYLKEQLRKETPQ
jgi:hypothetical protein